jgi:AcrR family transcriptional regulator
MRQWGHEPLGTALSSDRVALRGAAVTEPFRETVRTLLRDRLLDAAASVFADQGWRRLTMAKVADRAGVSRQTVYNEFGSKQALADALILRELETFLTIVRQCFEAEDTVVPAVRSAVAGALTAAHDNRLLRSVLDGGESGDNDLLPLIVQSPWLVDRATAFLVDLVDGRFPDISLRGSRLSVALESVVRLVLSHVTRPSRGIDETADDLAFVVAAVLAGAGSLSPS